MECQFCKKTFSSTNSRNVHQTTTRSCLKIQEKLGHEVNVKCFSCAYCNKSITSKINLKYHMDRCIKKDDKKDEIRMKQDEFDYELRMKDDEIKRLEQRLEKEAVSEDKNKEVVSKDKNFLRLQNIKDYLKALELETGI